MDAILLPDDPFVAQHAGLVQVHRALATALAEVAGAAPDAPLATLVPGALGAGRFVLGHHHAESAVLFPGLRRAGRLRSADVAFLDARDREHRDIHALTERLLDHAAGPHPAGSELVTLAAELAGALAAHVAEEEVGLAPDRLRRMISADGLAAIAAELEALRGGRAPR